MKMPLVAAAAWLCCAATYADISVDVDYGASGIATVPLVSGLNEQVLDVAIDASGRAVTVGQTYVQVGQFISELAVARLNIDGTPDNTFSGDGRLYMPTCAPPSGSGGSDAAAVVIQADGKILVAGSCHAAPNSRAVLVRFLPDGALDGEFGTGGIAYLPGAPGTGGTRAHAIGLQSDGRIVVGGQIGVNTFPPRALVMRVNVDGTLDTTFAADGYHVADAEESWYLALEVMSDDRIVAAGHVNASGTIPANYNFFVARLQADGSPDTTFNVTGFHDFDLPPMPSVPTLPTLTQDFANGIALRADGRILIAGSSSADGSSHRHPVVAQLLATGLPDSTFGNAGFRVLSDGTGDQQALGVFVRAAGDLVIVGNMAPVQLAPDGDAYFPYAPVAPHWQGAMQSDGHLVVGTRAANGFSATRLLVTDATFPDNTPDAFAFAARTNVTLATPLISAPVTIHGLNTAANVSVQAGEFSVGCTGTWLPASQVDAVTNGGTVCVRHTSSSQSSTTVTTILTVGGVAGSFSSTTGDVVPDAFTFADRTGVAGSTPVVSAPITISGLSLETSISVAGGEMSIGCTATYTSTTGTVSNGQTVCVRHTSAAAASTSATTTLTVGTVSDVFQSTTAAATPDGGACCGGGGSGSGGGGGGGALDWWLLAWLGLAAMIRRSDFCRFIRVQTTRTHGFP